MAEAWERQHPNPEDRDAALRSAVAQLRATAKDLQTTAEELNAAARKGHEVEPETYLRWLKKLAGSEATLHRLVPPFAGEARALGASWREVAAAVEERYTTAYERYKNIDRLSSAKVRATRNR